MPCKTRPTSATPLTTIVVRNTRCIQQMVSLTEAPGVSNVRYWDAAATAWEDIQDTFICDTSGVIKRALNAHIGKSDELIDFGCGGGRYLKFVVLS